MCLLISRQHLLLKKAVVIMQALFCMCDVTYDGSEKSRFYFNGESQRTASKNSILISKHPLNNTGVPARSQ